MGDTSPTHRFHPSLQRHRLLHTRSVYIFLSPHHTCYCLTHPAIEPASVLPYIVHRVDAASPTAPKPWRLFPDAMPVEHFFFLLPFLYVQYAYLQLSTSGSGSQPTTTEPVSSCITPVRMLGPAGRYISRPITPHHCSCQNIESSEWNRANRGGKSPGADRAHMFTYIPVDGTAGGERGWVGVI